MYARAGRAGGQYPLPQPPARAPGLEIGWTRIFASAWGTGANVEAKLLMLGQAFERLGCMRVEFQTNAATSAPATPLRPSWRGSRVCSANNKIVHSGELRDTAYYSIVDDEWPEVRLDLRRRFARRHEPTSKFDLRR